MSSQSAISSQVSELTPGVKMEINRKRSEIMRELHLGKAVKQNYFLNMSFMQLCSISLLIFNLSVGNKVQEVM